MPKLPPCVLCGEPLESFFSDANEALAQCNEDGCELCHEALPDAVWHRLWKRIPPEVGREKRYGMALKACRFVAQTKSKAWTVVKRLERIGKIASEALKPARNRKEP